MNREKSAGFLYPEEDYNPESARRILPLILDKYRPNSLLDMGCGNGSWLAAAAGMGIGDLLGVDLSPEMPLPWQGPAAAYHSANLEEPLDLGRRFDLILCLETAEHLGPSAAETLVDNLVRHGDHILFSAAIPGQGGEGHRNEQWPSYWQDVFRKRGFRMVDDIRPMIWGDELIRWWYRQNLFSVMREGYEAGMVSVGPLDIVHPEPYLEQARSLAYREAQWRAWQLQDRSIRYHLKKALKLMFGIS